MIDNYNAQYNIYSTLALQVTKLNFFWVIYEI